MTAALESLPPEEKRLLVAVSGGPDSMALLAALCELRPGSRIYLEAACLDHGLRSESRAEVETVRTFARARQIPFHTACLNVPLGPNLEARCRAARYAALEEIRSARGLALIVTAHTADDQAETLLYRLARGTSLKGAAGIRSRQGRLLRPLLEVRKGELLAFAQAQALPFHSDPMNRDARFARVRARTLLPALEDAFGAGVVPALGRFSTFAARDDAYLDLLAAQAYARIRLREGLDRVGLCSLPEPLSRRILARLLEEEGLAVSGAVLERALAACLAGHQTNLTQRTHLLAQGGLVRIARPSQPPIPEPVSLRPGRWTLHPASQLEFHLGHPRPSTVDLRPISTLLAPQGNYWIRTALPGDRLGFGNRGKLQDFFVNRRIPREIRKQLPLVIGEDGRVACVVGWGGGPEGTVPLSVRIQPGRAAPPWFERYKVGR